jgi:hypothetical protein
MLQKAYSGVKRNVFRGARIAGPSGRGHEALGSRLKLAGATLYTHFSTQETIDETDCL